MEELGKALTNRCRAVRELSNKKQRNLEGTRDRTTNSEQLEFELHAFELAVGELGEHVCVPTVGRHLASLPLTSCVHVGKGGAKPHRRRQRDENVAVHARTLDSLDVARDVEAEVLGPFLFASRGVGLAKHGVFPAFAYGVVKEALEVPVSNWLQYHGSLQR